MSTNKINLKKVNENTELSKKRQNPGQELSDSFKKLIDHKAKLREVKALNTYSLYQQRSELSDKEWAKVREAAQRLLQSGQEGYDNYMSAMSKILQTAEQRNKWLLSHNNIGDFLYHTIPGVLAMPLVVLGLMQPEQNLLEVIGTTLIGSDRLPSLNYCVGFNDDNTLNILQLTRDNHTGLNPRAAIRNMLRGNMETQLTEDEMLAFQALVVAWLEKNGYKPDSDHPGKFKQNGTGAELTKARFEELADKQSNELLTYLKKELQNGSQSIEVNELPPSPSMRP